MDYEADKERVMTIREECRQSRRERWCFVCGTAIAEGQALAQAHLGFLTHMGTCSAVVDAEERVYDRSPRGRWRSKPEVRERVRARRLARGDAAQEAHADGD